MQVSIILVRLLFVIAMVFSTAILAAPTTTAGEGAPQTTQGLEAKSLLLRQVNGLLDSARKAAKAGDMKASLKFYQQTADLLKDTEFQRDYASVLREMSLHPDRRIHAAGREGMSGVYYARYEKEKKKSTKTELLTEAVAWKLYADSKFSAWMLARKGTTAENKNVNIYERAKKRLEKIIRDDELHLTFEMIREDRMDEFKDKLKTFPYPLDTLHSVTGIALIHAAAWYQNPRAMKLLVEEYKVDVNQVDREGDTALDYANYFRFVILAEYLKSQGGIARKREMPPPIGLPAAPAPQTPAPTPAGPSP